MRNYIYGLAYTDALRTVVLVLIHIVGLILFYLSMPEICRGYGLSCNHV